MSVVDHPGRIDGHDDADEAIDLPELEPDAPDRELEDPPPFDDGPVRKGIDVLVVAACAAFVFWQLHPELILADTTPAGGDMGAHVWAFAYLRDVLLPAGRLSGWTPDWYAGFPVFQFYMVVPFLGMVLLNAGLGGVAALLPGAVSAGFTAKAAGARRLRPVGAVIGGLAVVGVFAGAWSGFGSGFRFVLVGAAVAAALVAGRVGRHRHRRWLAAAAVVIAVVGVAFPYGPSFKLITVAGVVAMPVSAYLFGRLARLPYPTPALLAVATVGFGFDKGFTIYGGNIASTMAGEFAFSISLALAIAYLGVVLHGLRTGTHRATAAVLLALVGLTHLIPAFFALGATVVFLGAHLVSEVLTRRRAEPSQRLATDELRRPFGVSRLWWLVSTGAVAALLAAWWVLPFFWQRTYLNDMGWEKIAVRAPGTGLWTWLSSSVWPELVPSDLKVFAALALVGAVLSIIFRSRVGTALVVLGLGLATAFVFAPQGRLWNARLLPFWYLVVYFLAAIGVGEVIRALSQVFAARPARPVRPLRWLAAPVALVALAVFLGGQLRNLPTGRTVAGTDTEAESYELFSFLPGGLSPSVSGRNFVTDWSRWNYSGYERKNAYPEYRDIVATMASVGRDQGCGMSMWEYSPDLNDYGTPMALMLLPHWTDGCIGSMEGLYFEASSTTPFHFLMQSELSASPSRAQRDLPYRDLDIDAGVEHLQLMGVQYYLARSAEAVSAASAHTDLTEIAASGPWVVYEVDDAPMVQPLAFEPAVTTAGEGQDEWLCASMDDAGRCSGAALDWFQDSSRWDVALAAQGPDDWQRLAPGATADRRPLTPSVVDDVAVGRDGISFTVDRPGTPVLVKQSYFPNWQVSGAEGPYRVAPNLMVVVPTDTEVSMTYGRTGIDWLAIAASLAGIGLLVVLARSRSVALPRLRESDTPLEPID